MTEKVLSLEALEQASAATPREAESPDSPVSDCVVETLPPVVTPPITEPRGASTIMALAEKGKPRPRQRPITVNPFGLTQTDLQRGAAVGVIALVALFFFAQVASILPPFIIAFFCAALLDPTLRHYERRGTPRVRTILVFYALTLTLVGVIAFLIVPRAASQLEDMSTNFGGYTTNIQKEADTFLQNNAKTLERFGVKQKRLSDLLNQKSGPVRTALTAFLGGLTDFVTGVASKILWLIVIPVATFFLARDYSLIRARFIALFPESYQERVDFISCEIVDVFSAYLRGLGKICTLFALAACVLFWLLGVDDWLLLGMLGGMFYAVPYVGQLGTSTVVGAVCYSMAAHKVLFIFPVPANSTGYVAVVILSTIGMGVVFDQIIYPRVVGGSVGLHPVVSIFAITAGATLFGVPGVLLAVPVAASIKVVLMCCFPRLAERPPAHLLEPRPPLA